MGKTTSAMNLSASLATLEKKTLLIDAAPQANASSGLGVDVRKVDCSIYESIVTGADIREAIYTTDVDNLDIVPAHIDLVGAEIEMLNFDEREKVMKKLLDPLRAEYDYILIDCMPSLGMLTINAFASVDAVIIPVQAAYLPVKGLEQLIRTIGKVRRQLNKQLKIGGILITMVDNRTNYARDISDLIFDTYGNQIKIFPQSIPFSVRAAEISAEGISIFEHDPKGKVAAAYWQMTQEVLLDER